MIYLPFFAVAISQIFWIVDSLMRAKQISYALVWSPASMYCTLKLINNIFEQIECEYVVLVVPWRLFRPSRWALEHRVKLRHA